MGPLNMEVLELTKTAEPINETYHSHEDINSVLVDSRYKLNKYHRIPPVKDTFNFSRIHIEKDNSTF